MKKTVIRIQSLLLVILLVLADPAYVSAASGSLIRHAATYTDHTSQHETTADGVKADTDDADDTPSDDSGTTPGDDISDPDDPPVEEDPDPVIPAVIDTIELMTADDSVTRRLIQKDGGDFGTELVAVIKDENGAPIADRELKWSVTEVNDETADEHMAVLSTVDSQTDDDGKLSVNITILDDHVGTAVIKVSDPDNDSMFASVRFEVYSVAGDEEVSFELDNKDAPETYAYPYLITLPEGSEYRVLRSVPEEQNIVSVDENGVAEIKKATEEPVEITDRIVKDGIPVDSDLTGPGIVSARYLLTVSYRFTGIVISSDTEIFYAGHSGYVLKLDTVLPAYELNEEQTASVTWISSDEEIAEVTGNGSTTASLKLIKPGNVTVNARIKVGNSEYNAYYTLEVLATASRLAVLDEEQSELSEIRLSLGAKRLLRPAAYDRSGILINEDSSIPVDFVWKSDNESVVKVNSDGFLTTLDEGTAVITLTDTYGEKSVSVTVTVVWEVTALIPDMSSITIEEGKQSTMNVSILPYDIIPEKVSLNAYSDNTEVAEALISGKTLTFIPHSAGRATVTVSDEGSGQTCAITVDVGGAYIKVTGLKPIEDAISIYAGDTKYLRYSVTPVNYTDTRFVWESRTSSVVSVDPVSGEIEGLKKGNAIITVSAIHDGTVVRKATYSVTVRQRSYVDYINISPGEAELSAPVTDSQGERISAGETLQLLAVVYPENALGKKIKWSSSNEKIATVEPNSGLVEAKSTGTAVITAQAESPDEITPGASCSITVHVRSDVGANDADTGRYSRDSIWIGNIEDQYYTGAKLMPEPNVYYGSVLLDREKDYTFAYKDNVNVSTADPLVTVRLKGDYSGTVSQGFKIRPADISEAVVDSTTVFVKMKSGVPVEQLLVPKVTYAGKKLKAGVDFEVEYTESIESADAYTLPGKWGLVIRGEGNYTGEYDTYEYIVDKNTALNIAKETVVLEYTTHKYTGEPLMPKVTAEGLTEGEDYEVLYSRNTAPSTASVLVKATGLNVYGVKKLTFKILPDPESLSQCDLDVEIDGRSIVVQKGRGSVDLEYVKGGLKPAINVYRNGIRLGKKDCSVSSKIDLKTMTGTITIKGKGNYYKDSAVISVNVSKQDIRNLLPVVDDFAYSARTNAYQKNTVTIYDKNGKALTPGTDYRIFAGDWEAESDTPAVGSIVTVFVEGEGFYDGRMQLSFNVVDPEKKINSSKVFFRDDDIEIPQSRFAIRYAGMPVCPDKDIIILKNTVREGRNLITTDVDPANYKIIGYVNNGKPGTATVILKGRGEYAGIKNVTYKIKK